MDLSIYLTAPLQLDRICRACLSEKGDMKPLFGACLDEMLLSFANIQVQMSAMSSVDKTAEIARLFLLHYGATHQKEMDVLSHIDS